MADNSHRSHRPDPCRTVKIRGPLNQQLVDQLKPAVRLLQKRSKQPITIFIKSRGGGIDIFKAIDELCFTTKGQRPVIVVGHGSVRSAAAYLLVMGEYAYAKRGTRLVFHGVRYQDINAQNLKSIKKEDAMTMFIRLEAQNRNIVSKQAEAVIYRVIHRFLDYWLARNLRKSRSRRKPLLQLHFYINYIRKHLHSAKCQLLLEDAYKYTKIIYPLACNFHPATLNSQIHTQVAIRAKMFKFVFSRKSKFALSKEDTIHEALFSELMTEYFFLCDIMAPDHLLLVRNLALKFGQRFLTKSEYANYKRLNEKKADTGDAYLHKIAAPVLFALWHFSMALCRRLMILENPMRAADAYWLGLLDEILETKLTWEPIIGEQRKRC